MRISAFLLSLAFSARRSSLSFALRSHPSTLGHRSFTTRLAMTSSSSSSQLLVSLREKLARTDNQDTNDNALGKLILASQSPRRREILDMMGLANLYEVEPSPLDESKLQSELVARNLSSKEYTCRLAEAKAKALAEAHAKNKKDDRIATFYLGSDTIVELDEKILEKPEDMADAKRMLTMMSGRQHHVHTGVALYRLDQNTISLVGSFTDTATVTFADLGENDIDAYIASGEPMDKAGSYGIQGIGGQFVTEITGDFFTVMGIPMHKTSRIVALALQDEASKQS